MNHDSVSAGTARTPSPARPAILMTRETFEALPEVTDDLKAYCGAWRKALVDGCWRGIDPWGTLREIEIGTFVFDD